MQTKKNIPNAQEKSTKKKSRWLRKVVIGLVIIVILLLVVVIAAPIYLSSQSGTGLIVNKINNSIDGKVAIGDLSMGWFKGVDVSDISFDDNAGTTSVKVKSISTKPSYVSLLRGRVDLGRTSIVSPEIVMNVDKDKTLEVKQQTEKVPAEVTVSKGGGDIVIPVTQIELEVSDGSATFNLTESGKEVQKVVFSNIASKVALDADAGTSSFDMSTDVSDGGGESKVIANGKIKGENMRKGWSLGKLEGDLAVKIDKLELETLRPLMAIAGQDFQSAGVLDADVDVKVSDGKFEKVIANAVLKDFKQVVGDKVTVLSEPVTLNAQVSGDAENINIEKLDVKSSFCELTCTGGTEEVDYKAKADLGGVQDFAGQFADMGELALSGKVTSAGKLGFNGKAVKIAGTGKAENFVLRQGEKSLPSMGIDAAFNLGMDLDKQVVSIDSVDVRSEQGKVTLSDSTITTGEEQKIDLKAKANVDLGKTQGVIEFFSPLPEGMKLEGVVDSSALVEMSGNKCRVVTDATTIRGLKIAQPGEKPFEEELITAKGEVVLNLEEKMAEAVKDLRIESKAITLTGNLSQSREREAAKIEGKFEAEYDLGEMTKMAGDYLPEGFVMAGKRKGTVDVLSEYDPTVEGQMGENLTAKSRFGFDKAEYMGLEFGVTDMSLDYDKGKMSLDVPGAPVNGGTVRFAGMIDFNEEPMVLRTTRPSKIVDNVNINEKMGRELLMYLNPIFAEQGRVSGKANFQCDRLAIPLGKIDKNKIVVEGTVGMEDVKLSSAGLAGQLLEFTDNRGEVTSAILPTKFTLENGMLSYREMQVNLDVYPATFGGKIGLDKQIDMTVKVPYKIDRDRLKLKSIKVGDDLSGRLEVGIEGMLPKPSVDLSKLIKSGAEDLIKGIIQKEGGKEVKDLLDKIL